MKAIVLVWFIIVMVFVIGWGINLAAFFHCDFQAPYKAEICRGIGIVVAPIGGIEGYITIKDGNN